MLLADIGAAGEKKRSPKYADADAAMTAVVVEDRPSLESIYQKLAKRQAQSLVKKGCQ